MSSVLSAFTPVELLVWRHDMRVGVRRVYCVGRNYADHAREMGGDPDREPPFFFTKFPDTVVPTGSIVSYPPGTSDLHHEVELVVVIGRQGFQVTPEQAPDLIAGYAVGLDLTRRDLQAEAKKAGRPWDVAKNFDQAAPIGPVMLKQDAGTLDDAVISLQVNGEVRQEGRLSDMIWSIPELISTLSKLYVLEAGDVIFTGTPSGVGPVVPGDRLVATVAGLAPLEIGIGPRR